MVAQHFGLRSLLRDFDTRLDTMASPESVVAGMVNYAGDVENALPVVAGVNGNQQAFQAMPWQQRERGQNYPTVPYAYQPPEPRLLPPLPPGVPAGDQRVRLTPFGPENVRVPESDGQSLQGVDHTPGWQQQSSLDMAVLMANVQSLATGLQQVMEENKKMRTEMQGVLEPERGAAEGPGDEAQGR